MSFKICVIGCGSHSTRVHGPSYRKYAREYPDTVLAACCDLDPVKAERYRRQFGFKSSYTNIDEMLDAEKPDAVCLIVKEQLIAPLSIKVIEQGYPILLEKPPGLTREETLQIAAAAEKYRVPNKVAFNRWHVPLMVRLKAMMHEHLKAGELHHIRYDFFRHSRTESDFHTTAIHGISAVAFLADSPFEQIHFTYQELPALGENVANIYMACKFESGLLAHLHFCPVAGVVLERATVNGLNQTIFAELPIWAALDHPGKIIHLENGKLINEMNGSELADCDDLYVTNGFYAENESFFNGIRSGSSQPGEVLAALQIVDVADCISRRQVKYVKPNY